jgi:hypothetical protein
VKQERWQWDIRYWRQLWMSPLEILIRVCWRKSVSGSFLIGQIKLLNFPENLFQQFTFPHMNEFISAHKSLINCLHFIIYPLLRSSLIKIKMNVAIIPSCFCLALYLTIRLCIMFTLNWDLYRENVAFNFRKRCPSSKSTDCYHTCQIYGCSWGPLDQWLYLIHEASKGF